MRIQDYDIDSLGLEPKITDDTPSFQNSFDGGPYTALGAGEFIGNTVMQDGYLKSSNYVAATTGWYLAPDTGEFNFAVSLGAGSTIGGFDIGADYIRDAANSFGLASTVTGGDDVRFWAGATFANRATAPFRLTEAGVLTATSATVTGAITATSGAIGGWNVNSTSIYTGTEDHSAYTTNAGDITIYSNGTDASIHAFNWYIDTSGVFFSRSGSMSGVSISSIPNDTSTDISLLEATHDLVFSVTDKDTVAWATGTITLSNGRTFSIVAGNTGNMVARTYIYLDTGTSSTVLQTTTTVATAMGANKKLIAVAQNGSAQAQFTVYGGIGGAKLPASGTSISNNNWTYSGTWSVTDADTIAWGAGTLTTSDGGSYSITGSNTGNMAAKTYVYFDLGTSSTAFQTTTTAATAIGDGKILIAICQNGTNEASFIVVNDKQHNIDASNIVTGSITANEIAAGAVTATKISVSQLSAIAADLGTITAGSLTINSGVASISSAGAAVFKSIQVGGSSIQYTIGDGGIFTFGDGSDGTGTFDGSGAVTGWTRSGTTYTADRDTYFTSATVSTGVTLKPNGYRMFGTGTLTLNGTAVIQRNGNAGGNGGAGAGAVGGTAGAALADGYLKGSPIGAEGGGTSGQVGYNGTNTSNSLGSNGSAGGQADGGVAGGSGGTRTAANVPLRAGWHLQTLLDVSSTGATVKYDNSASAGGGGATSDSGGVHAGGGGGGSPGGIIQICFRSIVVGASASITANGGAGGNGGTSTGFGGGGGGGGNGGQIILVYNSLSNSGSITASAGAAGAAGSPNNGQATAGTAGTAGTVWQFQISL